MMDNIISTYKRFYVNYIQSLSVATSVKQRLLDEKVFSGAFTFYLFYPRLFSNAFNVSDDETLKHLSISGFLYYQSLINLDRAYDSKHRVLTLGNMSIIVSCQEEAIKILSQLFGCASGFWKYWNQRKQNYQKAQQMEQEEAVTEISQYYDLADYKSEFGKVAIDALHLLSGKKYQEKYEHLLQAHRCFSIANQFVDDIQDIIEDREQGQFNWVLRHLSLLLEEQDKDIEKITDEEVKKHLYSLNLADYYYEKADHYYKKALEYTEGTGAGLWENNLRKIHSENAQRIDTIRGYKLVLKTRFNIRKEATMKQNDVEVHIPKVQIQNTDLAPSISYLINEWKKGYTELKHIMYLSEMEGFSNKEQIHIGDTFQRAIVTDVLCDIESGFPVNFSTIVQKEISYLMSRRNEDRIGGWSYFPTVPEIAADIDDLGQVIQLLVKANEYSLLNDYCSDTINFAVEHCMEENGGMKTWILPREKRNERQQRQYSFNQTKWGEGPDVEVTANFLYALSQMDEAGYREVLSKGCDYLKKEQEVEGYWQSRWYYGDYYGTYVCSRMLQVCAEAAGSKSIQKSFNFIMNSQNQDGGWGLEYSVSDALNTSLALLTLRVIDPEKAKKAIARGERFLLSCQSANYSWPGVRFIRPRINEPYKSRTLTTAYVLKALTPSLK
ncbi:MAG: hypothetical protein FH748_02725 [Balneolaceae bacterium]|nr:hypothetical protein [Balneolaceae bacterium]